MLRRGARREATLGRRTEGTRGDVDAGGYGVSEWVAAGVITEAEARAALGALSGRFQLSERAYETLGAHGGVASAQRAVKQRAADLEYASRLRAGAERVCQCSRDGGGGRVGCVGLCRMAERHADRVRGVPLSPALERPAQRRALEMERERRGAQPRPEQRARASAFRDFLVDSGDLDADGRPAHHHDHRAS
jgi:hypothetical protein